MNRNSFMALYSSTMYSYKDSALFKINFSDPENIIIILLCQISRTDFLQCVCVINVSFQVDALNLYHSLMREPLKPPAAVAHAGLPPPPAHPVLPAHPAHPAHVATNPQVILKRLGRFRSQFCQRQYVSIRSSIAQILIKIIKLLDKCLNNGICKYRKYFKLLDILII